MPSATLGPNGDNCFWFESVFSRDRPYQADSFSGVEEILWIERSAPLNSCS